MSQFNGESRSLLGTTRPPASATLASPGMVPWHQIPRRSSSSFLQTAARDGTPSSRRNAAGAGSRSSTRRNISATVIRDPSSAMRSIGSPGPTTPSSSTAKIDSRLSSLQEGFDHAGIVEPNPELEARPPRLRDDQPGRPDAELVADVDRILEQTRRRQVLAEDPRRQLATEPLPPGPVMLARIGVDGLVRPAVDGEVRLSVAVRTCSLSSTVGLSSGHAEPREVPQVVRPELLAERRMKVPRALATFATAAEHPILGL